MKQLHFTVDINAPAQKVWDAMLGKETYKQWTAIFNPTSSYEGDWTKGSPMKFIGVETDGTVSGMLSRIADITPPTFVSIEHLGFIKHGVEDRTSDEVKAWAGAHENYTLEEINGKTLVKVDMDVNETEADYFQDTWPKALEKLKQIVEQA